MMLSLPTVSFAALRSTSAQLSRRCALAVLLGSFASGLAQTPTTTPVTPPADPGAAPVPAMPPDTKAPPPVAKTPQQPAGMQGSAMQPGGTKPLPSPSATADTILNGKTVIVKYNSPAMRGRKIMGELVPYGKVWRTGANSATSFVTAGDVMVGTLRVPAGSYTMFTLPAAPGTPWMLILNKQTGQWGLEYHQDQDLGRVPMESGTLPSPQESMSISFEKAGGTSVQMHVRWESTDEYVTITPAS